MEVHWTILFLGFGIAAVMGAIANKTNFCTMGAVSDWVNMGDTGRLRAWFMAWSVALLGVIGIEWFQLAQVEPSMPPYRTANFAWLRYIVGGVLFGIGMTLASGCGNKCMVRIGGGNIKSIFVLFIAGIFAYLMTRTAFYEKLFHPWVSATTIDLSTLGIDGQDLGSILAGITGVGNEVLLRAVIGGLIAFGVLFVVFRSAEFRKSFDNLLGGFAMGAGVLGAWYVTGRQWFYAEEDSVMSWTEIAEWLDEKPISVAPQSYTFINPMGDFIGWLMEPNNLLLVSFGLMALAGVTTGSFVYSVVTRKFRIEWFTGWKDFFNHAIGAILMGIGGVLGMGCTFGQGITGVSTLAVGSFLTLGSIILGSALTMKVQFYRMVYEDEATFLKALVAGMADLKLLPNSLRSLDPV